MTRSEDGYPLNSEKIVGLANKLQKNGCKTGWHRDKNEYIKPPSPFDLSLNRNHFLIYDVNKTMEELVDQGVKQDYTLGYAEQLGFRSGTCHPYQVFSLKKGQAINLTEYPLTMMDVTLYAYMKLGTEEAWQQFIHYFESVKRHRGNFVLLWHNFSLDEWRWRKFYKNVVNYIHSSI